MTEQEVLEILARCGAILTGTHVCLTPKADGWYHSDGYVAKDEATKHPKMVQALYQAMAEPWYHRGIEVVVGPAVGAIAIAHGVALKIAEQEDRDVLALYTEPEDPTDKGSPLQLKRGFDKDVLGRQFLVVEDVLTSGGSALRTIEAVRRADGNVVGLSVIANRGGVTKAEVGDVDLTALINIKMDTWPTSQCPLCQALVPLNTTVGKGSDWLKTDEGRAWLEAGGSIEV